MAVYTPLSRAEIASVLAEYDVGEMTDFGGILEGIDNTNYWVATPRGRYVLTLFEKRVDPRDLPFFFAYMAHLSERGLCAPAPVSARSGAIIQQVAGRPAALVAFLDGRNIPDSQITPELCEGAGLLAARMHLAAQDFPLSKKNPMAFPAWKILFKKIQQRETNLYGDAVRAVAEEIAVLESNWPQELPEGVVHADLFPDNVFQKDGQVSGVIDFYFACTEFLAYDFAILANAWCFDADSVFRQERFAALLRGYETVRPLSIAEKSHFQTLARGAALRFLVSRLHDLVHHDPAAQVVPKDPNAYFLRLKFWQSEHGKVFG
jgi:homoserine kinase type II